MNQLQPNFETLKRSFYQAFVDSEMANFLVSMQSLKGILLPSWHNRKEEFKKDFNTWLDRVDIRQAGELILVLKENNKPVPKWMKTWRYNIDYNENGMLDLIRIEND